MRKLTVGAILALSVLSTGLFAKCGSGKGDYNMMQALWSLNLNEAQENRLDMIVRDYRKARIDAAGKMMDSARLDFSGEKFDKNAFIKAKEANLKNMLEAEAEFYSQIHANLTPDQRKEFAENMVSCGVSKRDKKQNPRGKK